MKPDEKEWKAEYRCLRARLGKTGWISHGCVQDCEALERDFVFLGPLPAEIVKC